MKTLTLAAALLPFILGAPAVASTISDPVGDFIPSFTGTASPDLDSTVRSWSTKDLLIVSDAGAPSNLVNSEQYYATKPEAVAAALKAGLDSFTDNDNNPSIITTAVKDAVNGGLLSVADVENADRHILSIRFRLGEALKELQEAIKA